MATKTLSVLIGSAVAAVAAFALVTIAPVIAGPGTQTVAHVEATAAPGAAACAQVTFDATFTYTVKRPLLNLWGFAEVRDLSVDHVKQAAATVAECTDQPVTQLTAWIILPKCDREFSDASALAARGWFTECGGNAVAYATDTSDGARGVLMTYDVQTELANSGLVRDSWCPEFADTLTYGSTATGARVTSGDLCLDLR